MNMYITSWPPWSDRLRPLLVRYRGKPEGRFTAPAQDVPDLVPMLEATGRYVRDISVWLRDRP